MKHKSKLESNLYKHLWKHQIKSIELIKTYLNKYNRIKNIKSALIHLPTGAGKTGVMASICHYSGKSGSVLILCPRNAIRDQLHREISGAFFAKLNLDTSHHTKLAINVKESSMLEKYKNEKNLILIMNIHMLDSLSKNSAKYFEKLKKDVDLIMIDEGHCEPAISHPSPPFLTPNIY